MQIPVIILPLLVPLATAIAALLAWNRLTLQRAISAAGAGALLAAASALVLDVRENGIRVMQIGSWPAPFGISVVADMFSALMVLMAGIVGFSVAVYALASTDVEHEALGYHPLYQVLLLGCCGSFLTGDIFNLYVWFEVMLISSFALLALGGRRYQMEGAMKYVALNLISSAVFLAAIGLLYGMTGTLNMAHLATITPVSGGSGFLTVLGILFFLAFGIKAALFPLFFWLPASYHTPPVAVSAVFAGLLTKVGVYALIRIFTMLFVRDAPLTHALILAVSGLTMVTGILGALVQNNLRRILSFVTVSQVGYMIMGLGLFSSLALAGSVFYLVDHIIVETNLFLLSGMVRRLKGSYMIRDIGGMYAEFPLLAVLFLVPALSLAGVPPLSGFWAKLTLVASGLESGNYVIAAAALGTGTLTLLSVAGVWQKLFWAPGTGAGGSGAIAARDMAALAGPMAFLAGLTILLSLYPSLLLDFAGHAARQLLDPAEYIAAVLGGAR